MDYVVNVEKVLENKTLPSWIYKCAFELKVSGYLPTGDFFEKLDDEELDNLKKCAEKVETDNFTNFRLATQEDEKNLQNLALLCMLLALGEGVISVTPEDLSEMMHALFILISTESLYRKDMIEAFHLNYSLIDGTRPIARGKP